MSLSMNEAARQVLADVGKPLHVKELWREIEQRGLVSSEGKTPWQTLDSELRRRTLGSAIQDARQEKFFYQHGPGAFGLLSWLSKAEQEAKKNGASPVDSILQGLDLTALRQAYVEFSADPRELARVKLRRYRAAQIRDLFRHAALREPTIFEHEVWRYGSVARIGERDLTGRIYADDLTNEEADAISAAIDAKTLELYGNFVWKEGTTKFSPMTGSETDRRAALVEMEAILVDDQRSPEAKVKALKELKGIGWGVATGLGTIFHPREIALFNSVAPELATRLGIGVSGRAGYQAFAVALMKALELEDLLELDWFLYQIWRGKQVLPEPVAGPKKEKGEKGGEPKAAPALPVVVPDDINIIYFGPPGTGKTFRTAARAVEIIDGELPTAQADVMARYAELRESNHIAFVTFHQSYSYEEFVEGIRPALASDEEGAEEAAVEFECTPGVFRNICDAALADKGAVAAAGSLDLGGARIWKLSLGNTRKAAEAYVFDDAMESGYALLGYGKNIDFSGADDREAVDQRLREASETDEASAGHAVHRFKNEMAIGDIIVVSDGNRKFRAIGRVTGDYVLLEREKYAQARPVSWLFQAKESLPHERIMRKIFSQNTFYELSPEVLKIPALKELVIGDVERGKRNYVLIIDEINRGNVAKVFGELITLLEPDKRLGAENEVRVKLPYSQDEFGVPHNLYVIGTMNTADRSIALLDTALRRRFRFVELMPASEVVRASLPNGGVIGGVDVARLLETLNERIEILYDRDHMLGHAYFLKCSTLDVLRDVFVYKVIPLLQEYFYDDWEKICWVLSCPFDGQATKNSAPILVARVLSVSSLLPNADEYEDKVRYSINPEFLEADEPALAKFFAGVCQSQSGE